MDSKTVEAIKREAREYMSPYFDDEDIAVGGGVFPAQLASMIVAHHALRHHLVVQER